MAGLTLGTSDRPLRVAVVGSGPSGFYAIDSLLRRSELTVRVDLFDRLPTPFGLVRGGVAPDHQSIKRVASAYEKVASHEQVRFFGNVMLGRDVSVAELSERYDAVIYAVGNESDRKMGLPGEELKGVHSATEFVFWYNAHPDYAERSFELSDAERVVVIGNGNVAMDVARVLTRDPEELAVTDCADHAVRVLRESALKEVILLGRRGPAQAAFSPKEIKELGQLSGVDLVVTPRYVALDPATKRWMASNEVPRTVEKNVSYLTEQSEKGEGTQDRKIRCWFLTSPLEFIGEDGRLTHIKLVRNELREENGRLKSVYSDEIWVEEVQLAFKAIGYRGVPIPGLPFDDWYGVIPNVEGRVMEPETETVRPGEYVVGWAKRGPSGLVGTNKPDSFGVVDRLVEDLPRLPEKAPAEITDLLEERGVRWVSYGDWQKLDALERARGEAAGKIREKFVSIDEMLAAIG